MEDAGERPQEVPTTPPAEDAVRLEAHASDQARVYQAARDLHVHDREGGRGGWRVGWGVVVGECPYPGLVAFGRAQARWFFGREGLTGELIGRLDGRLRTGGVQAVVAPSGAGKSSLLHAGLLPRLSGGALGGSGRWPTVVFTPTSQPLRVLAAQIAALTGVDPAVLAEQLMADSRRDGAVPRGRIRGVDSDTRLVMVVDQFEELFTLCTDDRQRRTFIELLAQITDPRSGTGLDAHPVGLVIIGIRADFYADCVNYSHLRTALQDNPLMVGPMSDAELREVICHPAQGVGLDIEPGLVELLLRDLGDTPAAVGEDGRVGYAAGRLPLLAHALRATWQQRHGHTLTVHAYQATGGIQHAVATTADRVFAGFNSPNQDVARILFLRLIKIGDGTEDTRRRMSRTDLLQGLDPSSALPLLDAFTQARLLTQDEDTVEITHEALLRAWPRLRHWVETDRAGNLTRQELEEATAAWKRDDRDNAGLYRGSRLEVARAWAASRPHESDLSPAAAAFLAASTQQEHRAARIRRGVLVMLTVLALLISGTAIVAFRENASALRERDTAIVDRIVADADRLRSTDVSLAAQLDLTAYVRRPQDPELRTKLLSTENTALSTPLNGHNDTVTSVAFSPDGRTLASASDDKTVQLWDMVNPAGPTLLGKPLIGHIGIVASVAFSPDRKTLATAGGDDTVRFWEVADPAHPAPLGAPLAAHTSGVNSVAFSPDGRILASAGGDHTVRLWNLTDPARPVPLSAALTDHNDTVYAVAFSPDGRILASASGDRTVRLWNLTDPAHPARLGVPLTGHTNAVYSVVFSPDRLTMASAGNDRTVRLWNIPRTVLTGHTHVISEVVFSPDRRTLASASLDHTVRLWDVTNPANPKSLGEPLTGHDKIVWSVAFSPDGRTLASASADSTVRLWNVTDPAHPTLLGEPLGHSTGLKSVAFSPDGRILATAGEDILATTDDDTTIRLWNMTDPARPTLLPTPLIGHDIRVWSVAFSPDSHTLASASQDRDVRLWNVTHPARPISLGEPLSEHSGVAKLVAFSPDGYTLASASADHTVRLWNVTKPAHPIRLGEPLTGHRSNVSSVAFSPEGHYGNILATASADQTVRLWDLTNPSSPLLLGALTGHANALTSVAFSPDGSTLATGGGDQTVQLLGMNVELAIQRICATTRNNLTIEKWEQYVSKDPTSYSPPCPA